MKKGQFGFTTLIIFIALIATAAIAAGVILYTTGVLQQRAYRTGQSAIGRVSSGLEVFEIDGFQYDPSIDGLNDKLSKVTAVDVWLRLRAGSSPVSLTDTSMILVDEDENGVYNINFRPVVVPSAVIFKLNGSDVLFRDNVTVPNNFNVSLYGYIKNCSGAIEFKIDTTNPSNPYVNLTGYGVTLSATTLHIGESTTVTCGSTTSTLTVENILITDPAKGMEVRIPYIIAGERITNSVYIRGLMNEDGIVDPRYYGLYWDPAKAYSDAELIKEEINVVKKLRNSGADITSGLAIVIDNVRDLDQYIEEGETYEVLVIFPYAIDGKGNYLAPEESYDLNVIPKIGNPEYISSKVPEVLNMGRVRLYPYSS